MAPIEIKLSVDAANAAESVNAFVEATRESIEKAYTTAVDRAQAKLDELNRKQVEHREIIERNGQAIEALQQKRDAASQSEQRNIDQEIAKLKTLTDERQRAILQIEQQKQKTEEKGLIALGATDAEIAALRKVYDANLATLGTLADQVKAQSAVRDASMRTSTDAIAGIYKLVEQQRVHQGVIEADKAKLAELETRRQEATGAEVKRVDQEITSLKKTITGREDEMRALEAKRIKLEELLALEHASSETEMTDIKKTTEQRLVEVGIIRDTAKAQNAATDAIDKSTNSLGNFLSMGGQLVGIVGTLGAVQQGFSAIGRILEDDAQRLRDAYAAADHFRDLNTNMFDKIKPFLNEMGITDPTAQKSAEDTLFNIAKDNNLSQSAVADGAAGIAPMLRSAGIDIGSAQGKGLIQTAGLANRYGLDPSMVGNVLADQLHDNPQLSGDQFNQRLGDLTATAGSPKFANELMGIEQEQKQRYGLLGMTGADVEKMFISAGKNGIAPQERGASVSGYLRGLDRAVGKTPEEYLKLYEEMTGVKNGALGNKERIAAYEGHMTPDQMLAMEMRMHGTQSFPELDALFKAGASGQQISMTQIAQAISTMSPQRQEQVMTALGGPRATASAKAIGDWNGVSLPTGAGFTAPQGSEEAAAASKEFQNYQDAQTQPTSPTIASFEDAAKNMQSDLDRSGGAYYQGLQGSTSWSGKILSQSTRDYLSGGSTKERQAQFYVLGEELYKRAKRLQDMADGKIPNNPKAKEALEDQVMKLKGLLKIRPDVWDNDPTGAKQSLMVDLEGMDADKRKAALKQLDQRNDRFGLYRDTLDTRLDVSAIESLFDDGTGPPTLTPDEVQNALDNTGGANAASRKPTPAGPPAPAKAPTSQPVSINVFQRNSIYGYTQDAVGSPNTPANNYG